MAPLDEPSLGELIRTLSAKIDMLTARTDQFHAQLTGYVTQEQRQSDKELRDLQHHQLATRLDRSEANRTADRRLLWSAVVGPVIVGLVLWFLIGGGGT